MKLKNTNEKIKMSLIEDKKEDVVSVEEALVLENMSLKISSVQAQMQSLMAENEKIKTMIMQKYGLKEGDAVDYTTRKITRK